MYQYGTNIHNFLIQTFDQFMFHMNYVIEGSGALVNEKGVEKLFKTKVRSQENPTLSVQTATQLL
jgi:hypothetical protein